MPTIITTNGNGRIAHDELLHIDEAIERTEARIAEVEEEVRVQGKKAKSAQQAWSIFAVLALVIALVNLLAVAAKLDSKSSKATAAPAVAAAKPATPAPAPTHTVAATLKEFSINPTAHQAAAGRVTFNVRNTGTATHEFVVLRTDQPAAALPLSKGRADESGNVGETGDLAPGAAKTIRLNLKPGHYALICNLPGHYVAGQRTDLTVR
jgi:uncharacterized cupredoxin-like copper-binding protein